MTRQADTLYKQLFSHPEILRELLTGFLAVDWAASLDVGAFERVNASYASERGKARHDDMVWRVNVGGEWLYVYILLEFQSRSERWMALRMQVYIGLLYQDLVRQRRLSWGRKLPPVLQVVLYSGRQPWRAPPSWPSCRCRRRKGWKRTSHAKNICWSSSAGTRWPM